MSEAYLEGTAVTLHSWVPNTTLADAMTAAPEVQGGCTIMPVCRGSVVYNATGRRYSPSLQLQ